MVWMPFLLDVPSPAIISRFTSEVIIEGRIMIALAGVKKDLFFFTSKENWRIRHCLFFSLLLDRQH